MNTPTDDFSIPLDLHAVADRLREVTPEAHFRYEATHSSRCFCSMNYQALDTKTITERRSTIKNSDYWKQEAIHHKTVFANVVFDVLLKQCTTDSTGNTDSTDSIDWQKMTHLYKRRFARQGLDAEEFEKHRRSIKTEEYWKVEEECIKKFARIDQENLATKVSCVHLGGYSDPHERGKATTLGGPLKEGANCTNHVFRQYTTIEVAIMAQPSSLANVVILFAIMENPPGTVIRTLSDNVGFLFTPPQEIHDGGGEGRKMERRTGERFY
ncbi:hypothetical protein MY11210_009025 [Beauveria gryllotalpidicola]